MGTLHGLTLLGCGNSLNVASLVSVIFGGEPVDLLEEFLRVGAERIVFDIKLDFLDGLSKHELVLFDLLGPALQVQLESLVDIDYFLEVQLLEVDIQPPYKEIDDVALFQLTVADAPQALQDIGHLPVKLIEALDILNYVVVPPQEGLILSIRQHLLLEGSISGSMLSRIRYINDLLQKILDEGAAEIDLVGFSLLLEFVETEKEGDGLRREEVGVDCRHLN